MEAEAFAERAGSRRVARSAQQSAPGISMRNMTRRHASSRVPWAARVCDRPVAQGSTAPVRMRDSPPPAYTPMVNTP